MSKKLELRIPDELHAEILVAANGNVSEFMRKAARTVMTVNDDMLNLAEKLDEAFLDLLALASGSRDNADVWANFLKDLVSRETSKSSISTPTSHMPGETSNSSSYSENPKIWKGYMLESEGIDSECVKRRWVVKGVFRKLISAADAGFEEFDGLKPGEVVK